MKIFYSYTGGYYGKCPVRNTTFLVALIGHVSCNLPIGRNEIFTVSNQFIHP